MIDDTGIGVADVTRSARFYPSGIRIKGRVHPAGGSTCDLPGGRKRYCDAFAFHAGCAPAVGAFPMGQVIHLTISSAAYPNAINSLERAERTFVQAMRLWFASYRRGDDPVRHLCEVMRAADAHDAAFPIDRLMALIARTARQPIAIYCQRCPHLEMAARTLRTALLSAHGAEFALSPLEGLGELFAEAKLLFRRRRPPVADASRAGTVEAKSPLSPAPAASLN